MSESGSGGDSRPPRHVQEPSAERPVVTPRDEPDVYLDVPVVKVEEINLEVENLRARVSLQAEVLDLLRLNVGADVALGRVNLTIKGVEAQALLQVRLDNVAHIIDRVMNTIDDNPQILENLTRGVATAVEDLGTGAGHAVRDVGTGAGRAVQDVGTGAGRAVQDVGAGAGQAVQDVGAGAGHAVEDVGTGAGRAVTDVGAGAGQTVQDVGAGTTEAVQDVGTKAVRTAGDVGAGAGQTAGTGADRVVQDVGTDATGAVRDTGTDVIGATRDTEPGRTTQPERAPQPDRGQATPPKGDESREDHGPGEPDEATAADEHRTSELATALARASFRAGRKWLEDAARQHGRRHH
ncbi:hypothetical protein ITP53_27100 [Nonomuraea sp. K274]|uniref:Uncharacterized protein n=1 Tax=Nonomuraea cypriaca TaxID=1187855 RepID=A0A931F0F0_9ACTN|nr:hypothetical protein [Nonomuraea cypriaca]MBF8189335.1 hypothetical protein [Nonomuraea cypriaca]